MAAAMSSASLGMYTAFASSSSGPSYHASLRRDLQAEASGYLSSLAQQIQVQGFDWLEGYMEGVRSQVAAAASKSGRSADDGLATILKTPVRTAKKNKTRAIAAADREREEKLRKANREGLTESSSSSTVSSATGIWPKEVNKTKENVMMSAGGAATGHKPKPTARLLFSPRSNNNPPASPRSDRTPSTPNTARRHLAQPRNQPSGSPRGSPLRAIGSVRDVGRSGLGGSRDLRPLNSYSKQQTPAKKLSQPKGESIHPAEPVQREVDTSQDAAEASPPVETQDYEMDEATPAVAEESATVASEIYSERPVAVVQLPSTTVDTDHAMEEPAREAEPMETAETAKDDDQTMRAKESSIRDHEQRNVELSIIAEKDSAENSEQSSEEKDASTSADAKEEADVAAIDESPKDSASAPSGTYDLVVPLRDDNDRSGRKLSDRQSRGSTIDLDLEPLRLTGGPSSFRDSNLYAHSSRKDKSVEANASAARASGVPPPKSAIGGVRCSWLSKALGGAGEAGVRKSLAASVVHAQRLQRSVPDEQQHTKAHAVVPSRSTDPAAPHASIAGVKQTKDDFAVTSEPKTTAALIAAPASTGHHSSTFDTLGNQTSESLARLMAELQEKKALAASQSRTTIAGPNVAPSGGMPRVGLGTSGLLRSTMTPGPLLFAHREPEGKEERKDVDAAPSSPGGVEAELSTDDMPAVDAAPAEEQVDLAEPTTPSEDLPKDLIQDAPQPRQSPLLAMPEASNSETQVPTSPPSAEETSEDTSEVSGAVFGDASVAEPKVRPDAEIDAQLEELAIPFIQESTTPTNTPPQVLRRLPFVQSSGSMDDVQVEQEQPEWTSPKAIADQVPTHSASTSPRNAPGPAMFAIKPVIQSKKRAMGENLGPAVEGEPMDVDAKHGLSYSQAMTVDDESRIEDAGVNEPNEEDLEALLADVTRTTNGGEIESDGGASSLETSEVRESSETAPSMALGRKQSAQPPFKPAVAMSNNLNASRLNASTNSRSGATERLAHAERIANKTFGQKPAVPKPSSLTAASQAREQQLAADAKRKAQRDEREQRKRQKLEQEKEREIKQAAEERQRRIEDLERRKREREQANRRIAREADKVKAAEGAARQREQEATAARNAASKPVMKRMMVAPPGKGKDPLRAKVPPPQGASGSSSMPVKAMGAPVRPLPHQAKASNAGPNNPFASSAGPSRPTAGSTITLVKPPPSRTSTISVQRPPMAQLVLQNTVTPAPKPARDELTKLQRRIAMGGSASPQIRPEDVELPDISSDFGYSSDSGDERKKAKKKNPDWADSPEIRHGAAFQQSIDPEDLFGKIPEVVMDDLFPEARKGKFRPRSSSANWSGTDRLTKQEEIEYATRMGYKHIS